MKNLESAVPEKRAFPRYRVKDHCAVFLSPGEIVSYAVLDFSKLGLSFCYKGSAQKSREKSFATAIFFSEYIDSFEIPVQIISDSIMKKPDFRRCGLQFCFLTEEQEQKIDIYLDELYHFNFVNKTSNTFMDIDTN